MWKLNTILLPSGDTAWSEFFTGNIYVLAVQIALAILILQLFLYSFVTYIMCVYVGKGLPTYCVTVTVGRQPLAASDKQSNQWALKTL